MLNIISKLYIFVLRLFGIKIGKKVRIWPLAFFSKGQKKGITGIIEIGSRCEISQGVVLKSYGGEIKINENTFLGEYSILYGHGGIEVGSNTLIAMHTCIVSSNHSIPNQNKLIRDQNDLLLPVKIGNDVWIGAGVKILGGVNIGDGCIVGAGAVVSNDLPSFSIALGVPAKVVRYRNE
ncbi:MAG: acyltransferase [Pedobacter sp.]|nr:MAG: acyltransferase [Pedobacter sp.]